MSASILFAVGSHLSLVSVHLHLAFGLNKLKSKIEDIDMHRVDCRGYPELEMRLCHVLFNA